MTIQKVQNSVYENQIPGMKKKINRLRFQSYEKLL